MGGFLLIFIIFPCAAIFFIILRFVSKDIFNKAFLFFGISVVSLICLGLIINFFTTKKEITEDDIYGEYVIARKKCAGKQADWQYNHFRFEITKQNTFLFHITEKEKIIKTYKGTVSFKYYYVNPRIVLNVDTPRNHIIENEPTLYREAFSFYYVFHSPKFGNVFFKKGKWKEE